MNWSVETENADLRAALRLAQAENRALRERLRRVEDRAPVACRPAWWAARSANDA